MGFLDSLFGKKKKRKPVLDGKTELPPLPPKNFGDVPSGNQSQYEQGFDQSQQAGPQDYNQEQYQSSQPIRSLQQKQDYPDELPPLDEVPSYEDNQEPEAQEEIKNDYTPVVDTNYQETDFERELTKPALREVPNGPLFMSVQRYQEILQALTDVKENINEASDCSTRLNDINKPWEEKFGKWRTILEDITHKLIYMDKTMFER